MTQERPYQTLSSRYLWQSRWYNLRQDQLRAADGSQFTYTVVEKPDAVWVVPVTNDGQVVLINQYRYAIDAWCLEVPAGNVEPGSDPHEMARRELREEIGGITDRIVPVAEFYTMNGIGNEVAHIFAALDVTLAQPAREPTEHIRLRLVPIDQALRLARSGDIKDGPSALALLLSEPVLRNTHGEHAP
ncbi:MAG: NUDIX hydrolase [Chloroflexi bacterium]|nr:NUDIX hydrolase [Chloroflexota bacterium]